MLLAICGKKLAIFASTGNYFRPCLRLLQTGGSLLSVTALLLTAEDQKLMTVKGPRAEKCRILSAFASEMVHVCLV